MHRWVPHLHRLRCKGYKMAVMNSVYRKLYAEAIKDGKTEEEAHNIASQGADVTLVDRTKKRLAATFEGKTAVKAGSETQIRAMKRRGGTIPGINQPKKQFNTMATTQTKDQLRKAGLSEEQIKALRGR